MHRTASSRWLTRALRIGDAPPANSVPLYLCPALGHRSTGPLQGRRLALRPAPARANHTDAAAVSRSATPPQNKPVSPTLNRLPTTCSGCGAFSQTDDPEQLGYFNAESKRVRRWREPWKFERKLEETDASEDEIVHEALRSLDESQLEALGLKTLVEASGQEAEKEDKPASPKPPVCERCHNLIHYSTASDTAKVAMYHPTVESLRETIEESPHKYNHIYHVVDAADFPMSLVPRLNVLLGDVPLRSRNRRSKTSRYQKDRMTEMSFIITRSDLLAPRKEMVDALMPQLQQILREALGRLGNRVRLGNLRCVSAMRGWWTKSVKRDVWKRGGAGWMVGKVNVGKSQLFEAIYPKGRMAEDKTAGHTDVATYPRNEVEAESLSQEGTIVDGPADDIDLGELLPPPQPAQNYPEMPVVSSLPGTTASPIRIPFGNSKGELIDLPGLARTDLELYVKAEHRKLLVMTDRIVPVQVSVGPGKSLILGGGLIRITPRDDRLHFLMYNFTPLREHLTSTRKAVEYQAQTRQSMGFESICVEGAGEKMKHAGTFKLRYDVTKKRAGPLTRKDAVGIKVERLPFRVVSIDILIEGVGYIEVVAQVRWREFNQWAEEQRLVDQRAEDEQRKMFFPSKDAKKEYPSTSRNAWAILKDMRRDDASSTAKSDGPLLEPGWPAVDVYTPEGRFVGSRQPINGWLMNKPLVLKENIRSRPRRSMKGMKKMAKEEKRRSTRAS